MLNKNFWIQIIILWNIFLKWINYQEKIISLYKKWKLFENTQNKGISNKNKMPFKQIDKFDLKETDYFILS